MVTLVSCPIGTYFRKNQFFIVIIAHSYLPPIWYIAALANHPNVMLEQYEFFVKQSIRNRCHILSPNGIQTLVVPVVHSNRTKTIAKDIQISYDFPWQRQHWRSMNAAYRRSAYFEFYMDDLAPFYHKEYKFLVDLNLGLLEFIMKAMNIKSEISFTENYQPVLGNAEIDLRETCNTGIPQSDSTDKSYSQVFSDRHEFKAGLSAVDLLFNTGPQSSLFLTQ